MPVRFSISESGRGEDLEEKLIALEYRLFDLKPMAEIAQEVMEWQNEQGALAGVDQYGHAYDKLAESTLRKRGGGGPPLAPRGPASRIINFFETDLTQGFDEYTVRGHWPGLPWIRFHKTGTRNMPERDPVGMRPIGWARLAEEFREWVRGLLDDRRGPGPAAPPASGGGGPSSSGPLAPTAANGPGINRYDAPDDGDELMIDVRPSRSSAAKPDASPLAPTRANGVGLVQHEPAETTRAGLPSAGDAESRYAGAQAHYGSQFDRAGERAGIEANVRESIRKTLGYDATPRQIAALVGAPADATRIYVNTAGHTGVGIEIEIDSPRTTTMKRSITARRGDRSQVVPATTIHNDEIKVVKEHQGQGIATRIFADQVEAAAKAGFKHIATYAAREHGTYNGYSTWPKLGYDGMIPESVRKKLPGEMAGATRVSELMATPAGKKFWDEHGISTEMSFDLTPGSYSRNTLDAYLKAKGIR